MFIACKDRAEAAPYPIIQRVRPATKGYNSHGCAFKGAPPYSCSATFKPAARCAGLQFGNLAAEGSYLQESALLSRGAQR